MTNRGIGKVAAAAAYLAVVSFFSSLSLSLALVDSRLLHHRRMCCTRPDACDVRVCGASRSLPLSRIGECLLQMLAPLLRICLLWSAGVICMRDIPCFHFFFLARPVCVPRDFRSSIIFAKRRRRRRLLLGVRNIVSPISHCFSRL